MKRFFTYILIVIALCSCKQSGYTIVCDIKNLDDGDVNLLDAYGRVIAFDTCKDGKFTLKGTVDVPCLAYVNNGLSVEYPIDIPVMLENAKIRISGDAPTQHIEIKGTRTNKAMVEYKKLRDALAPDDLEGYVALVKSTFEANSDNLLGAMMISNMYSLVSDEELLACCDRLPEEFLQDKQVYHYRDIAYARVNSAVGHRFIDLSFSNNKDGLVKLSSVVENSKATVVLFWSHWAREIESIIPAVLDICRAYESEGLSLYSIALEGNMEATQEIMDRYHFPGYCFVGDESSDEAAAAYGVDGLPRLVVIDHDGTIVARGSDASEVEEVIKHILN